MINRLNYKSIIEILKENLDSDTVVLFEKEYQKFNSEERDKHLNEETNHENTFEDFFINFIDMYFVQPEKMFNAYQAKVNKLMESNIVELENNQENKEIKLGKLEDYLDVNTRDREKEENEFFVEYLSEDTQSLEKEINNLKEILNEQE